MLNSDYRPLCPVVLPFKGRQRYMHTFDLAAPEMAPGYEDYLAPVVALCRAAKATHGLAHMTVDEKVVKAGRSQRRPKPHVDGCFIPKGMAWGHPSPSWSHRPEPIGPGWAHVPGGSWNHHCNNIGAGAVRRMSVIVAASQAGCRAWRGRFDGEPASDGDLTHIASQLDSGEVLPANVGYLLSPDCVHESMVLDRDTTRAFLRIALPIEFQF